MTHASMLVSRQRHEELITELKELLSITARSDSERAHARHISRGRLLPRQRISQLLDPDSPLLEVTPLAAHKTYGGEVPAASIITGIGIIKGRRCLVVVSDATVSGGTYYPLAVKKHPYTQGITGLNYLSYIYLIDPNGAMLLNQGEVLPDRDHFGRISYSQASLSARGIPQIAAVMGSYTADGAYVPVMSDEAVIVKD